MFRRVVILGTCVALSSQVFAETMTGKEIQGELIGKILCIAAKAGAICARHNAGGRSEIVSGQRKQKGTWKLKGNKLCVTWEKIRNGKEGCASYEKTQAGYSSPTFGKITVK
jgi:hypothetical protein